MLKFLINTLSEADGGGIKCWIMKIFPDEISGKSYYGGIDELCWHLKESFNPF